MCRFIETIRVEDGHPCLLSLHEERMNRTRAAFFPEAPLASLADCFSEGMAGAGVWKWRLVYDREGIRECTCTPYVMRRVERLRLVSDDTIDYAYKRADRSALEACFARRGTADDVLIVRGGLLTDTSIANVALWGRKAVVHARTSTAPRREAARVAGGRPDGGTRHPCRRTW